MTAKDGQIYEKIDDVQVTKLIEECDKNILYWTTRKAELTGKVQMRDQQREAIKSATTEVTGETVRI